MSNTYGALTRFRFNSIAQGAKGDQGPPGTPGASGSLAGGQMNVAVVNGANANVPYTPGIQTLRLINPTAPFSISGFKPATGSPSPGEVKEVLNTVAHPVTIVAGSETDTYPIDTGSGVGSITPARKGILTFVFDGTDNVWRLKSTGQFRSPCIFAADYGVKADGVEILDAVVTNGSAVVNSASSKLTLTMKPGMLVAVQQAGGGGLPLATTVDHVVSDTQFVMSTIALASSAIVSGTGAVATAGTPNFTLGGASLTSNDLYKWVTIAGAGAGGTPLNVQIKQVTGGTTFIGGYYASTTVASGAWSYGGGPGFAPTGCFRLAYGTDDTAALLNAFADASQVGGSSKTPSTVQLDPGISMHTGIDCQAIGITVAGHGRGGQNQIAMSALMLAATSAYALRTNQSVQCQFEDFWVEGDGFPSTSTVLFHPLTSRTMLQRLLISGAKPHVGALVSPDGVSEADNLRMLHCDLWQDPRQVGTTAGALYGLYAPQSNSQAFQIDFDKGTIFDTDYGCRFVSGSMNVRDSQIFNQQNAVLSFEATQPFEFRNVYTERNDGFSGTTLSGNYYAGELNIPFISESNGTAVNGNAVVSVYQCICNGQNPINYGGKQPMLLMGNRLGGDINLAKAAPPGGGPQIAIYQMVSIGNVFSDPAKGFVGDLSLVNFIGQQGNTGNDVSGHGGYGTGSRQANRLNGLEVAQLLQVSGSKAEHCTVLDVLPYLKQTSFNGTGQVIGWYDAGKGVTSVSGRVSAWQDQSGNGYTLSQPTAGLRPTYHPAPPAAWIAWSAGGNEALFGPFAQPVGITNPFEIFAVIRDDQTGFQLVDTANAYTGVNTGGAGALQPHGSALFNATEPGGGPTQDLVADIVFNGASSAVSYNGAADTTGNTGAIGLGPNLTLGNQHGASPGAEWSGRMYELLFVNVALSSTYRQQAAFALATKWGITWSGGAVPQLAYTCDTQVDAFGNSVPDAVVVSKSACGVVATLPPATPGRTIKFVDWTGKAGSVAPITVQGNGGATVNGGSSVTMSVDNGAIIVWSPDGFTWVATMTPATASGGLLAAVSTPAGVTVLNGHVGVVATATVVAPASGRIDITASLGPNGSTSLTSANLLLGWAPHGSVFPTGFTTVDGKAMVTLGPTPYCGVNAVVFGLTPGASYDVVTAIAPSGDDYHTTGATNANGGIAVRAL